MNFDVRIITADDVDQALQLGGESFGFDPTPRTEPVEAERPGRRWFGAFDGDRLVAQAMDREYDSWFGGAAIPTCGVAYVGVSPEYRGQGLVRSVLNPLLSGANDRGAAISTLFPTAPGIYRGLGFERITDLLEVRIPTESLGGMAPADSTTLRRAVAADMPAIRSLYEAWGRAQNGPLTRTGPSFTATDEEAIANFTGATLAINAAGAVTGYAMWNRGQGYDDQAVIHVVELIASTPDAYRALLRMIASFAAVTPHMTMRTSGDDPLRMLLPTSHWPHSSSTPYMLNVLDVEKAVSLRPAVAGLEAELHFAVGESPFMLTTPAGMMACEPTPSSADRVFTPQGFAVLYGGAQSCANLRATGGLTGGEIAEDVLWDALFGGRQVHIRDYF